MANENILGGQIPVSFKMTLERIGIIGWKEKVQIKVGKETVSGNLRKQINIFNTAGKRKMEGCKIRRTIYSPASF